ncbi:ribosomal protection-like ABC-F family protein [Paenibacillus sp. UNC499MF]|uniref:ribosomal protection-like ABC-F family protein n=1 Tax=Paenibacillus sp. UNC499MF TaxID=1502751 RepID=UPI0008A02233|nr:ABC-F family ATP-binding cassette domain-containing protein [Paenibacillus sp. UNC499MF]SEG44696.1 ATPase components of ABC transporters with duplicated ATPase domains [Paenibacillus sp. UNC499MF]
MILVNGQQIKKYHAANLVLSEVTFEVHEGEKIGLIGRNGSGKSTLLQLISRHQVIDEGMLTLRKELTIGYLPQIPTEFEGLTVREVLAYGCRHLTVFQQEMTALEQEMAEPDVSDDTIHMQKLLDAYASVQERFERGGGYEMDAAIDSIAAGLQILKETYARQFSTLSGGEKTRVALASQLIMRPDLLLLDEPTNHLDLRGIEWLEQFLQGYPGACILVSHDRYFLDRTASKIIELDDGEAFTYLTNYSGYVREKEERLLQQFAQYHEQQKVIKKMKETIRKLEEWGRTGDNEKFFKRAASMRKALDRMQVMKRPTLDQKSADFVLNLQDRSGKRVAEFTGVYKSYGERPVLTGAEGSLQYGEKIVLVGDNGTGKTTLFKLLLGMEVPDRGELELGSRVEIGYMAQQEEARDPKKSVLDYFRIEARVEEGEARGILAKYLFYGTDVFKPVSMLSGGEWSRLRLSLLVRQKPNLLLLDEPTNHLDIASREALEEALEEYPGTLLAISHDRYFINRLAQRIWELHGGKITSYIGQFDEYRAKKRELEQAAAVRASARRPADTARAAQRASEQPPAEAAAAHRTGELPPAGTAAAHRAGEQPPAGATAAQRTSVPPPAGTIAAQRASEQPPADATAAQRASVLPPAGATAAAHAAAKAAAAGTRAAERKRQQLEAQIAALEAQLASADVELQQLGGCGDTQLLEARWLEREELQARLDADMASWLELD